MVAETTDIDTDPDMVHDYGWGPQDTNGPGWQHGLAWSVWSGWQLDFLRLKRPQALA